MHHVVALHKCKHQAHKWMTNKCLKAEQITKNRSDNFITFQYTPSRCTFQMLNHQFWDPKWTETQTHRHTQTHTDTHTERKVTTRTLLRVNDLWNWTSLTNFVIQRLSYIIWIVCETKLLLEYAYSNIGGICIIQYL